jgi:ParB-like chromosome segregation protein Spo0J
MVVPPQQPALKPLHSGASLNPSELAKIDRLSTEELTHSLVPGLEHCLKTRPDGTILDGHHRIHILRQRGIDVDRLPRDVIVKE